MMRRRLNRRQRGAALATSLIFLILITLLAVAALRNSTLDQKLAENEQVKVEAQQLAQAAVEAVGTDESFFPVVAGTAFASCVNSLSGLAAAAVACPSGADALSLSGSLFSSDLFIEVWRLEPETFPMQRAFQTSGAKFGLAGFGIRARTDRSEYGLGIADLEQGQLRLVRKDARVNY